MSKDKLEAIKTWEMLN